MFGKRPIIALILIIVAIAIFALLIGMISAPPIEIDTTEADADIFFRSEQGAVIFSGNCVDISWQVDNIKAVYINHEPTVGKGNRQMCVFAESQPTLRVIRQDDTEATYKLAINILAINPLVILATLSAIVMFISGTYLLAGEGIRKVLNSRGVRLINKAIAPLIVIFVLTVLVLEITIRVYFSTAGTREEKAMYLWSREEIEEQDDLVQPVPYVNYIASPQHPEHNMLGYRGPDIAIPKPDGIFRIVALGGSTTYSTGTTPEESYPAFLQQILQDEYGYTNVEVINGGMTGYTSWENLANFAFRVLELEPDMIIIYAAVNDVVAREQSSVDCYRGHNALLGLNASRGLWIEQNQPLSASALYRFLGINLGWMPNPLALESAFEPTEIECHPDPADITLAQRVSANTPTYFERNLRSTIYIAQGNGIIPVLSSWAYYAEAERPEHWEDAIAQHNTITRDVATALDLPFYDLADNLPVDSEFWEPDGIHFVANGTHEQAEQYAQFLDESDLIPKP